MFRGGSTMKRLRAPSAIRFAGAALVALALVASACGKSNDTGSGGGATSSAGGTTSGGGATSPPGSTSGGGSAGATVDTASVGSLGIVLVDSNGMTLYHLTGETTSKFVCTGGCTQAWPPLQASGGPSHGSGAMGTLDTVKRPDGITQVTYDGLPLYTFSGDTKPGDANGQGVQGAWFAVTADGKDAKGGGGSTTGGSSSGGGRYGY